MVNPIARINDLRSKRLVVENELGTDNIAERTAGAGVTADGVLLKDNAVTASGGFIGNVTGGLKNTVVAITANGAVAVPLVNTSYYFTKAGVAAMTIVNPTATTHDGVRLTFMATTANANTLDNSAGAGFFSSGGATKDVATWGGAIGDVLVIEAYQGKWYIISSTNVTLG